MRHDKETAFDLRIEGKTYREIEKTLGISRSTLCEWFRNESWSKHIRKVNTEKHIKISRENLIRLNEGRKVRLDKRYAETEDEAKREFEIFKTDPLFIAGLMLYLGEGDKPTRHLIRLANIDFDTHKIFINFLKKFIKIKTENLRCGILLYPDLNIEECKKKWSKELEIPLENFYKTQIIQGKHKTKRLHYGVGLVIVISSFLKRKLLVWINLAKKSLVS